MIAFSDNPVAAEQQMTAIIYYMTTFGFVDGSFDLSEKMEIKRWIRSLVEMRVEGMGLDDAAMKRNVIDKQVAYFDRIFERVTSEIQGLFDEAVADGERPEDFVNARLKLRCFELFTSFDPKSRGTLLFIVNQLLKADGVVHENERKFRDELMALLDHAVTELPAPSAPARAPAAAASATTLEAAQRMIASFGEHPLLQEGEEHYSRDPARMQPQMVRDHALMTQAVNLWEQQRAAGAGRIAGKQRADELSGAPFLDGFVYGIPDDGRDRELIVIGDLHGCYSCLKAALLQADFFRKVEAHRANPAGTPDVRVVFLGDYIDRGRFSYDGILRAVLHLFVTMPDNVIVLRGNHEYYVDMGDRVSGGVAPAEAIASYAPYFPKQMFDSFRYLFERMPNMLIAGDVLCVHAGIPRDELLEQRWQGLATLNDPEIRFQMMWSDPANANFIPAELQRQNARFPFGKQQFRAFMEKIGCRTLIRGHEKIDEGFKKVYDEGGIMLLNLFSAGGRENNDLPANASYRSVTPMALTVRRAGGRTSIVPWAIEWQAWNQPSMNGFMRRPSEIEFRS